MDTLTKIFVYLFEFFASVYLAISLLRVLLQLSRADYYNSVSQFIVKATQPAVKPLKIIIPTFRNLDCAALTWCFIFQLIAIEIASLVIYQQPVGFIPLISWAAIGILKMVLSIFYFGLIGLIIISFAIMLGGMHISHPAIDLLRQLMSPVLTPFQRLLPPMGGLDLSPILVFMAIHVLQIVIYDLANAAGITRDSVILIPGL